MNVLALILARGGSTRIPRKNLAPLGGLSLVALAACAAKQAWSVTDLAISTDDPEIAQECESFGARWIKRPAEISGESATIEQAVVHALQVAEAQSGKVFDYVVSLQAAVPVRPAGAIDQLLAAVIANNARGGVSVVRRSPWIWRAQGGAASTWWDPNHYPRSQDIEAGTFEEINSIQVTPRREAIAGERWASPLVLLELPRWADLDIDVQADLDHARAVWQTVDRKAGIEGKYPTHLVKHPLKERAEISGVGKVGIILGNGPQIDALDDSFFRTLEGPGFISIGMNRICCSKRVREAKFFPDLHIVWDSPALGSSYFDVMSQGLRDMAGRTQLLTSLDAHTDRWPHDKRLSSDCEYRGSVNRAHMRHSSADLCINILQRLGCREIYLFGVELNSSRRLETFLPINEEPASCVNEDWARGAIDGILSQVNAIPGLQVFNACPGSRLEGHIPFKQPFKIGA